MLLLFKGKRKKIEKEKKIHVFLDTIQEKNKVSDTLSGLVIWKNVRFEQEEENHENVQY